MAQHGDAIHLHYQPKGRSMGKHNQPDGFRPPWPQKTVVQHGASEGRVQGYTFRGGKWYVLVKGVGGETSWLVSETRKK